MPASSHTLYWGGLTAGAALILAGLGFQHRKQQDLRVRLAKLQRQEQAMRIAKQRMTAGRNGPIVSTMTEPRGAALRAAVSGPALSAKKPMTWVAVDELSNAGRATPLAAFETMLWAASRQNVGVLAGMIDWRGRDRQLAEEFLQQLPAAEQSDYGTPERLLALLIANDAPAGIELYSVAPSPDSADVNVAGLAQMPDGHPQFVLYTFHETPSGWAPSDGSQWVNHYVKSLTGGTLNLPPVPSKADIPPPSLPDPIN